MTSISETSRLAVIDNQEQRNMPTKKSLSGNDAAVLGALFDPEASLKNHARIDLHLHGHYDSMTLTQIKNDERTALLPLNTETPDPSQLEQAISGLSSIISQYPQYPSAWNNRAQARRMLYNNTPEQNELLSEVFADLATAIKLASPENAIQMTSPDNAKVLASAHTHRGYLLWNASRPEAPSDMLKSVESLARVNKERLEELASRDFSAGGKYGNQTAQQLAVKTNPYAKLCGSIVREALQKEIKDFYGQSSIISS